MKFIVDNYSGNATSQSLYIYKHISENTNHQCYLNNGQISTFDLLDDVKPEVYISNLSVLSRDVIQYIRQNQYDMKLMINIDNVKLGNILDVEEVLVDEKINFRFFGNLSGINPTKVRKTKIFNLLDGYDSNIESSKKVWDKKINHLIVVKSDVDITNIDLEKLKNKTFHVASFESTVEIHTNVIDAIKNLYHNYDSVIFANLEYGIPQPFFDCLYQNCKAFFVSKMYGKEINNTLTKILKINGNLNFNDDDKIEDFNEIFDTVKQNHSYVRRVNSLLSQVS